MVLEAVLLPGGQGLVPAVELELEGDLLPGGGLDEKIATGFHRNAMQAKGNNPRKEEFRVKTVVDRLKTTGRTWLGLTLECAECHDHKHDPISQKEFGLKPLLERSNTSRIQINTFTVVVFISSGGELLGRRFFFITQPAGFAM